MVTFFSCFLCCSFLCPSLIIYSFPTPIFSIPPPLLEVGSQWASDAEGDSKPAFVICFSILLCPIFLCVLFPFLSGLVSLLSRCHLPPFCSFLTPFFPPLFSNLWFSPPVLLAWSVSKPGWTYRALKEKVCLCLEGTSNKWRKNSAI